MRWDNLFDDLESQLEHELNAEEVDLHAEEERLRLGRLSLRDRIMSLHEAAGRHPGGSSAIRLLLVGGERVDVAPAAFGKDWFSADLLGETARQAQCIVPLAGIAGLVLSRSQVDASLTARRGFEPAGTLAGRLGIAFVLRDLCRRRKPIEVRTADSTVFGTIDRVGRDHFDLAVHEPGEARRESAVTQHQVVRLSQLVLVRL